MTLDKFDIAPVDTGLKTTLQHKIDTKTKPVGSLGRLEEFALKIGLVQQSLTPKLSRPVIAVFAGDHGIAKDQAVSAYPQEVTGQMVLNFVQGGAAVNIFCRSHNLTPKIVDAGVDRDFEDHPKLINKKIDYGTNSYATESAMSKQQCWQAIQAGANLVDQWQKEGTNVIGFGEMGIGNTSSASIITSLITGQPIKACTGKGTGLDKKGVSRKTEILEKAIKMHQIDNDPLSTLATFGGFEIAMITGAMLQAAKRDMIIIVDGFIVTAAFLVAHSVSKSVMDYALFAHESGEAGHRIQLDYLNAKPILKLKMRLGEGSGAAMAYPVIKSAVDFLNNMASFEEAGVSGQS